MTLSMKIKRYCERCGIPLNKNQRRFCGRSCYGISQRKAEQSQWGLRKLARKHRKARCEYPGCEATEQLNIHHVDGDHKNFSPDNLKTLCSKHHMRLHTREKTRLLTYNRKTQSISEWAEELGILGVTIVSRLNNGWGVERALSTPVRRIRNFSEMREGIE